MSNQLSNSNEGDLFFQISLDILCVAGDDGWFKKTNPAM
jgi:hypothetical protein